MKYPTFYQALNKRWMLIGMFSMVMFTLSFNPIGWMMAAMSALLVLALCHDAESKSIGII